MHFWWTCMTDRHAGWRDMSSLLCLVFTSKYCHALFLLYFSHHLHRLTVKTAFPIIPWLYTVSTYLSLAHYILTGWWVSIWTPVSFKFLYTAFLMDTTITVLLLYLCPVESAVKLSVISMLIGFEVPGTFGKETIPLHNPFEWDWLNTVFSGFLVSLCCIYGRQLWSACMQAGL